MNPPTNADRVTLGDWLAGWIAALLPRRVLHHTLARIIDETRHHRGDLVSLSLAWRDGSVQNVNPWAYQYTFSASGVSRHATE